MVIEIFCNNRNNCLITSIFLSENPKTILKLFWNLLNRLFRKRFSFLIKGFFCFSFLITFGIWIRIKIPRIFQNDLSQKPFRCRTSEIYNRCNRYKFIFGLKKIEILLFCQKKEQKKSIWSRFSILFVFSFFVFRLFLFEIFVNESTLYAKRLSSILFDLYW